MEFVYKRVYRGSVKAAIFDWSGTTLDYGCMAPAIVFVKLFEKMGVPPTMQQAREPMGQYKKDHIRQMTQMPGIAAKWEEVHGRRPTEDDVCDMFEQFVPMQLEVLSEHSAMIPGALEAIEELRGRGLKIGSCTGYTREMMDIVEPAAKKQGYEPDCLYCGDEVPAGRPEPWMCLMNAMKMRVFPMESIVKVGDTVVDILEGLNAGMWTIGLARSGNELGLSLDEIREMDPTELDNRMAVACKRLQTAGAHYVVDSIEDVPSVVDDINARLARGETP